MTDPTFWLLSAASMDKLNECAAVPRWRILKRRRLWAQWVALNDVFQRAPEPTERVEP